MRKILSVITARPSYSRIKTVLSAIRDHPNLDLHLVLTSSALVDNYGSVFEVIEKDGFKINAKVHNQLVGQSISSAPKITALAILELSTLFESINPDIVLTVADRYETMSTAIAASYMNIPLGHIQGGEVTGNIDEKVRHSITKLSDYHFVASQESFNRVLKLGEDPDFVFNVGCPSIDIAREIIEDPILNFDPIRKYGGVGANLNFDKDYIVVMQHPVTTEYGESLSQVTHTLNAVHQSGVQTVWFWPNVDSGSDGTSKGIRLYRELNENRNIRFFKNMEPGDFLRLVYNAKCLVGNSSVGIRECSYLGVPVVNIGSRQHGRERGLNIKDVGYDSSIILDSILEFTFKNSRPKSSNIYGNGDAGVKIANILSEVKLKYHKKITY